MILLSVDPSVRSSGVAVFENDVLIHAFRIKVTPDKKACAAQRCSRMVDAIWCEILEVIDKPISQVTFEWPVSYPHSPIPPNDLTALAGIGMMICGKIYPASYHSYLPREWSGGVSKTKKCSAWESPRGKRIASVLSKEEKARVADQHDILDAVGIGLYHLGRMERKRVFPGARP